MRKRFEQLITDFCSDVSLAGPMSVMSGASFETNGVAFSLRYDKNAPNVMRIYTDFGPMPSQKKRSIYFSLLEENFITATGSTGTFGLLSASRNIVYIEQIRIDQMTPEKLRKKFALLSEHAMEWRVTHYIGDVPAHAKSAARQCSENGLN